MGFAKEAIDGRPPGLYYLIHWEKKMYSEDTGEPVKGIAFLRRLLKKYHAKNLENPTATSPPVDKSAPPPPMSARSEAKVPTPTPAPIPSPAFNRPPSPTVH